jgi:aminopeptidase-like protein
VLNLCDGTRDLLAVADRADRPIEELRPIADLLAEHGLLRLVGGADGDPPAG